jgi:hypothetical protein
MTDIVQGIDSWMTHKYSDVYSLLLYGFCELGKRTNEGSTQPLPMTITGTHKRRQVALDDRYQLITWTRLPGTISFGETVDEQDWAFGLDQGNVSNAGLRMIVAHKVELGENLIVDIARGFPSTLSNDNYKVISIDKPGISIDADHETIYNTELGAGQYEKHRTAWNLYVISLTVQYIRCGDFDENFRFTENGLFREIE